MKDYQHNQYNENGTKRAYELFPDAFEPRSTSKTPEVKTEKVEKKPVVASAPPSTSTTMIAGIPLYDWLALEQGDPETSKELMDDWKAEQAEKNATALAEKKVEEAKTKSKSAFKREGDSNSDLDLSNIAEVGISFATGSRKRRC
ncbi:hypothetical protein BcDW1_6149 [Botrytis cinerea BcDW1]|uniref:Uncharacterized protein n=1 Tax=Botryotinia fuckeliana (strain BcDW1) TaxID=1290391 RepID=M7TVA4_BOTF1|nr:hypothetical protein BcDW1_6149 [Botrytis cinerea BcDW1]